MPALEVHLTMVYVEALGTGDSGRLASHPDGYTRSLYAEAIDRLIDHLRLDKVHLMGHSYGGFVAQRYALDHPDRLSGLILYESLAAAGAEQGVEAARQVAEFAEECRKPEVPGVLAAFHRSANHRRCRAHHGLRSLLPAYSPISGQGAVRPCASVRVAYLSGATRVASQTSSMTAALPGTSVPPWCVVGRYDVICGVRWAEELRAHPDVAIGDSREQRSFRPSRGTG
jgi:pimeloyl-ACP methyl ester carboxylesterase